MAGQGLRVKMGVPEGQRYSCSQCGWCCRWWKITVTREERDRLLAHDWAAENPRLAGIDLFWEHRAPGDPYPAIQTAQIKRHCVFLDPDGLCIIHKVLGEDAKPATCRRFPIIAGFVGCEPVATLDYSCSAVIRNEGEPAERLEEEVSHWLTEASRSVHWSSEFRPVRVGREEMRWESYLKLEEGLLNLIFDNAKPVSERLSAGHRLISGDEESGSVLQPALGRIAPMIADVETPHTPTTGRGSKSIGYAMTVAGCSGSVHVSTLGITVDLESASEVILDMDSARFADLLVRFLSSYVMGKSLLKSGTIADGWGYMATCIAIAGWYAKASAAAHGRPAASLEDVITGLQVAGKAFVP